LLFGSQSAEKALKAVFQKLGAESWGHSVGDLLGELEKKYEVTEELKDAALELDKAYIPTRYPDAHPTGSPGNRYTKGEARRLPTIAENAPGLALGMNQLPALNSGLK